MTRGSPTETVHYATCDSRCGGIDGVDLGLEPVVAKGYGVGVEGIGLDDVCACFQVDPVNILDGLTAAKDTADTIFTRAERRIVTLDLETVERYRVVYLHEGAVGADVDIRVVATLETDFG